jgi:hypothetical protein
MEFKEKVAGIDVEKLCPKSMLNGPCGGVQDGMCELGGPCVWMKIYAKLKSEGKLGQFTNVRMPNTR